MNKKLILILSLVCFCLGGFVFAEFSADKTRQGIIKFMNANGMGDKLDEPVSVTQDASGIFRIKDNGSYLVQYVILTPENKSVISPAVSTNLGLKTKRSCDKAVIVTHGWIDKAAGDWPADLAGALAAKVDPNEWMVAYYDWQGGAAVASPIDAAKYSRDIAGPRLAKTFVTLLERGQRLSHVHLIGHSAGAWAVSTAAEIIAKQTGAQIHITLLDAYVPPNWDEKEIAYVPSAKKVYAEHYYTKDITFDVTHTDFTHAHNVDLTDVDMAIKAHEFPYKWYYSTVAGKYRKKDGIYAKQTGDTADGVKYGFERGLEVSAENFQESLSLKKANEAVKIPRKKAKNIFDISSWFKKKKQ